MLNDQFFLKDFFNQFRSMAKISLINIKEFGLKSLSVISNVVRNLITPTKEKDSSSLLSAKWQLRIFSERIHDYFLDLILLMWDNKKQVCFCGQKRG